MHTHDMTTLTQSLGAQGRWLQGALAGRAEAEGWVEVLQGRVWITRDGGGADHVLGAGEVLPIAAGGGLVAEPFVTGEQVLLRWRAAARGVQVHDDERWRPEAFWRGWLVRGLRGVALALAACARSAEAMARRAQGRICSGESMACSGALQ